MGKPYEWAPRAASPASPSLEVTPYTSMHTRDRQLGVVAGRDAGERRGPLVSEVERSAECERPEPRDGETEDSATRASFFLEPWSPRAARGRGLTGPGLRSGPMRAMDARWKGPGEEEDRRRKSLTREYSGAGDGNRTRVLSLGS